MQIVLQRHCQAICSVIAQRNNAFIVSYLPKLKVRSLFVMHFTWNKDKFNSFRLQS